VSRLPRPKCTFSFSRATPDIFPWRMRIPQIIRDDGNAYRVREELRKFLAAARAFEKRSRELGALGMNGLYLGICLGMTRINRTCIPKRRCVYSLRQHPRKTRRQAQILHAHVSRLSSRMSPRMLTYSTGDKYRRIEIHVRISVRGSFPYSSSCVSSGRVLKTCLRKCE